MSKASLGNFVKPCVKNKRLARVIGHLLKIESKSLEAYTNKIFAVNMHYFVFAYSILKEIFTK